METRAQYLRNLDARREEILNSIREQEKLTPELEQQIMAAEKMQVLEDLYLPYRPKKRTRAQIAREKGLEPLASFIVLQADTPKSLAELAAGRPGYCSGKYFRPGRCPGPDPPHFMAERTDFLCSCNR